ncbi:hypothetical protein FLSI110296_12725 [Flavobacterium sinopsychrotolerans]|uniref:Uncharacterized protein n=1 Tax=Flavobacterium sinopsychrotolerans TaxID=604089 RepID=A0A1H8QFM6_9FLAO|nr:hypothetical protein [Flavobacterium sinopsychrotolerans]SEO52818.1 hypothetical protein SAMN04487942_2964 [Flavobacterium sinopsychrotolerans]
MKLIQLFSVTLFFTFSFWSVNAQEKIVSDNDMLLKETIYNENRVKVLNFSLKEFDALFFEFFDKKSNPNLLLTKEEFYNYTIQIAVFSDRLAALYPDQKEIATENKKKWFAENYEDYLLSKASQKK